MTDMTIVKKIQYLKWAIILVMAANVFVLTSSILAGVYYFHLKNQVERQVNASIEELQKFNEIEKALRQLSGPKPKDSEAIYEYRKSSDALKEMLKSLALELPALSDYLGQSKTWYLETPKAQEIAVVLDERKLALQQNIRAAIEKTRDASIQLIIAGLMTIIFGFLLPIYFFYRLVHALIAAKQTYEEKMAKWLVEYLNGYKRYGEKADGKPFQDPLFWLHLVMISVEIFGPRSHHPIIRMVSELAPLVKQEIEKSSGT